MAERSAQALRARGERAPAVPRSRGEPRAGPVPDAALATLTHPEHEGVSAPARAEAVASLATDGVGNQAVLGLLGRGALDGRPLDPGLRTEMEAHLGADLGRVRVHTGPDAAASASALRARAYTVGHDVVFGPGQYQPGARSSRALIAHELTHAVQQARGGTVPAGSPATERAADASAARLAAGAGPAPVTAGSAPGLARAPLDAPAPGQVAASPSVELVMSAVASRVVGGSLAQRMMRAAVASFLVELAAQAATAQASGRVQAALEDVKKPRNAGQLALGYAGGSVVGFVSPATDLLGLAALAEQLPFIVGGLAKRGWAQRDALAAEATLLAVEIVNLDRQVRSAVVAVLKNPLEVYAAIEARAPEAVAGAGVAGTEAARLVVGSFFGDKEPKKPAETLWQVVTTHTDAEKAGISSLVTSKAGRAVDSVLADAPWADIGYKVGHAVGAVVSNLLLLVFSEGVGNAITKISGQLGKVAPLLARGGAALGEAITVAEAAIAAVISRGLKLIKPLEALVTPLLGLFGKLQGFLRRLLGVAQHEGAALAARGGTALADDLATRGTTAATPTPHPIPTPKAPPSPAKAPPTPHSTPTPPPTPKAPPAAPAAHPRPVETPHAPTAPATPTPAPAPAAGAPTTSKAVPPIRRPAGTKPAAPGRAADPGRGVAPRWPWTGPQAAEAGWSGAAPQGSAPVLGGHGRGHRRRLHLRLPPAAEAARGAHRA